MCETIICLDLLKTSLINREFCKSNVTVKHTDNCISAEFFNPIVDLFQEMIDL